MNEQILYNRPMAGCRLDMAHPLTKGLVGFWLFNEQGVRAMDLSPYGNHGTLIGFPSPIQRPFNGLPFNGVTQKYVEMGNVLNVGTGSFSVMTWVQPNSTGDSTLGVIVAKGDLDNNLPGWALRMHPAGTFYLKMHDGVTLVERQNSPAVTMGRVYCAGIIINRDAATGRVVTNGRQSIASSIAALGTLDNTESFRVGVYPANPGYAQFDGVVHLVAMWNRALTEREGMDFYMNPYAMVLDE